MKFLISCRIYFTRRPLSRFCHVTRVAVLLGLKILDIVLIQLMVSSVVMTFQLRRLSLPGTVFAGLGRLSWIATALNLTPIRGTFSCTQVWAMIISGVTRFTITSSRSFSQVEFA